MEGKTKDAILAEMPPRWSTFFPLRPFEEHIGDHLNST